MGGSFWDSFSQTSVGRTEKKLVEGKDVGLPVKLESPDFRTGSVNNSTLSGNSANDIGGGIFNDGHGTITLRNSLIVRSQNGSCAGSGEITAGVNNLIDSGTCGNAMVDPTAGDPSVSDLTLQANSTSIQTGDPNTGTTPLLTNLLKAGHPGINAGDNSLIPTEITTDQRGFARIVDSTVDIGAVERQPSDP